MKKVLLILFVILVIIIGVAFGGYFVFKDEIDVLQNEIENGTPFDAAFTIIKLQGKDYIELNENTFVMKTNYFTDNVEKFIENKYDVVKMQAVDTMILFEAKDGSKVITVNFTQNNLYTVFSVSEKSGQGTDFTITFGKKKNGLKKIVDAKKSEDYDYNIFIYNGKIDIKVKMRTKELKKALEDKDITMERIISKAKQDADSNLITATTFKDGGSVMYQYGTYTILKCNTEDGNEDVYIGPFGMQYEDVIEVEDENGIEIEKTNIIKEE